MKAIGCNGWLALAFMLGHMSVAADQPPLTPEEHTRIVEELGLHDDAEPSAEALYQRYVQMYQGVGELNGVLGSWSQTHTPLAYDGWDAIVGHEAGQIRGRLRIRTRVYKQHIESEYLRELASLSAGGEAIVDETQRARLRERWLGPGAPYTARQIAPGGDVIDAAEAVLADRSDALEQALREYERELDAILQEIETEAQSHIHAWDSTIYMLQDLARKEARGADHNLAKRINRYATDDSRSISMLLDLRDMQQRAVDRLAGLMNEDDARPFRLRIEPTFHPELAADPDPLAAVLSALERDDLSEQEHQAVRQLANSVLSRWSTLADRFDQLHEAQWRHEATTLEQQMTARIHGIDRDDAAGERREEEMEELINDWKEQAPALIERIESTVAGGA